MMVWLNAWPMCSVPVTLGGGSWMQNEGLDGSVEGAKYPRFSHSARQNCSISDGSYDLANSMISKGLLRNLPLYGRTQPENRRVAANFCRKIAQSPSRKWGNARIIPKFV